MVLVHNLHEYVGRYAYPEATFQSMNKGEPQSSRAFALAQLEVSRQPCPRQTNPHASLARMGSLQ